MRRREFLALLGSAAALARATQATVPVVGYIYSGSRSSDKKIEGLRQGLADYGFVIGRNLTFDERYADGDVEIPLCALVRWSSRR